MAKLRIEVSEVFKRNQKTTKRIVVNQGGTRSSKTYSVLQLFVVWATQSTGKTYDIVRGTLPALRATAMKDFFDILNTHGLYNEAYHDKTNRVYVLNGNEFAFYSIDDAQKVRGRKRDNILINEANEIGRDDFRQILMRTTGRLFIDFNPSFTDHWIVDEVMTREDCEVIKSTYHDNPFLEQSIIDDIESYRLIDPSYYAVYGQGDFADLKQGKIFTREHYHEEEFFPKDIRSILYCDPNLSMKAKGDTTAITHFGYSPSTQKYYVLNSVCKSFSDATELLNTLLSLKDDRTAAIGFDGNVNQESVWSQFVRNWCSTHSVPFPSVDYKRYRVDELSKNIQIAWNQDKIVFPLNFKEHFENKRYLAQLFSFESKKRGNPDDAPDSIICAFEFLHERGVTKRSEPILIDYNNGVTSQLRRNSFRF